jgi:hypothetical protein
MNPNFVPADSAATPRLLCRIVRQWSVLSGNNHPAHATTCASCRHYFGAMQDLETELRRDAVRAALPASSHDFAQQIIRSVREVASEPAGQARPTFGRTWTLGGLAATGALAALLISANFRPRVDEHAPANLTTADGTAVVVSAVQSLSSGLVDTVIPSAGELVAENPLQRELGSVYSDVRSALDFLALNFLPTSTAPATVPPSRQI